MIKFRFTIYIYIYIYGISCLVLLTQCRRKEVPIKYEEYIGNWQCVEADSSTIEILSSGRAFIMDFVKNNKLEGQRCNVVFRSDEIRINEGSCCRNVGNFITSYEITEAPAFDTVEYMILDNRRFNKTE